MRSSQLERPVRITSVGHLLFAGAMIWLGAWGLQKGDFVQVWRPVPGWVPAREGLAYLCALISLAGGIGLLWQRAAAFAARVLLATLLFWLVAFRIPNLFYQSPLVLVGWTFGSTAVMAAGAWVLCIRFAGGSGLRIARLLYGLSLIPFGLAHFLYVDATTVLIPSWLPWPAGWAYATGTTFIAAGLAILLGVQARLAAMLSTLQLALFGLIVWVPRVLAGKVNDFQYGEFVITCALTAGAWVVAESYRDVGARPPAAD